MRTVLILGLLAVQGEIVSTSCKELLTILGRSNSSECHKSGERNV